MASHPNNSTTLPPPRNPPPPLKPPPLQGGNHHFGPESIGNTRRQRKFLQGTEADLHCDTMVQICGAAPPPPLAALRGGTVTL